MNDFETKLSECQVLAKQMGIEFLALYTMPLIETPKMMITATAGNDHLKKCAKLLNELSK